MLRGKSPDFIDKTAISPFTSYDSLEWNDFIVKHGLITVSRKKMSFSCKHGQFPEQKCTFTTKYEHISALIIAAKFDCLEFI